MPTWRGERGQGKGRGGVQLEHAHRVAILEQHANGTPSSAIGRNIVSSVIAMAPWLHPIEVTPGQIRAIGFELTTIEETLAAREVAAAFAVKLIGFDETTDLHEPCLTSNVQVQAVERGEFNNVILKAAYLSTRGGESHVIVAEIEGKCFERLRDLMHRWKQKHTSMFPLAVWTGPDPSRCSLHRLAGGGAIISDTCNPARKARDTPPSSLQ